MDPVLFVAFLTTTLLIVGTPGPSCAFAAAQAIRGGPRAALVTIAGDALGSAVHIAVAVAGLATLIALADVILPVLQIAGGGFILWMAYRAFSAPAVNVAGGGHPACVVLGRVLRLRHES